VKQRWPTPRELEILGLVADGRSNRDVAKILWVTDQTIKYHLANAYRKLGVRNRIEASQWFKRHFGDGLDDGSGSGVREPRRPIKPTQSGSIAIQPH
jgi:DNA-binding CsgD family transcriptional regulator